MKLIDADKLIKQLNECFYDTTNPAARRTAHDTMALCQSLVNGQPTAYDVDKVVERLKERQKLIEDELSAAESCIRVDEIDAIKEIVKAGGVNE